MVVSGKRLNRTSPLTGRHVIMADTVGGFFALTVPAESPFYMVLENISYAGIAMGLLTQASKRACLTAL